MPGAGKSAPQRDILSRNSPRGTFNRNHRQRSQSLGPARKAGTKSAKVAQKSRRSRMR
jgi:hypothetical protein